MLSGCASVARADDWSTQDVPPKGVAMDIETVRQFFAKEIRDSDFFPSSLKVTFKPGTGDATTFLCEGRSRGITVEVSSDAMKRFCSAAASERGEMATKFIRTLRLRLADGGYNPDDPPTPAFPITINERF
jgi:hypothetical protein